MIVILEWVRRFVEGFSLGILGDMVSIVCGILSGIGGSEGSGYVAGCVGETKVVS